MLSLKTFVSLGLGGVLMAHAVQAPRRFDAADRAAESAPSVQGMYDWLRSHTSPSTGLVESYDATRDSCLTSQASTYDNAIAAIAYVAVGDRASAQRILEFFRRQWNAEPGFANFYHLNGRVGVENTVHSGVALWMALAALQFDATSPDHRTRFTPLALSIARWTSTLPHYRGGVVMGPRDGAAPWTRIVATEHQLDYLSVLRALQPNASAADRSWIDSELRSVKHYLRDFAYVPTSGAMNRGLVASPGAPGVEPRIVPDTNRALDTISWSIGVGVDVLREMGMDPDRMVRFAEFAFRVDSAGGLLGFDFTDAAGAAAVHRRRTVSSEWGGHLSVAYKLLANDAERRARAAAGPMADSLAALGADYRRRWSDLVSALDRLAITDAAGLVSYPYASSANDSVFTGGWKLPPLTPAGKLPGSVAGTAWRIFAAGFNPMTPASASIDAPLPRVQVTSAPTARVADSAFLPSSVCTASGFVDAAWINLDAGRLVQAIALATSAIERFGAQARAIQAAREARNDRLIAYRRGNDSARSRIFSYGVLNDVGAALFIVARARLDQAAAEGVAGRADSVARLRAGAAAAFRTLVDSFALAQVWDPRPGRRFFWAPALAAQREYAEVLGLPNDARAIGIARGVPVWVSKDWDSVENHWIPSGFDGDTAALDLDDMFDVNPASGRSSIRIAYSPSRDPRAESWAAVRWLQPENNWGTVPDGGFDLRGAKRLVFVARADREVTVEFGMGGVHGPFGDSMQFGIAQSFALGPEWKTIVIPLDKADDELRRIINGFTITFRRARALKGAVVMLDEIRYE